MQFQIAVFLPCITSSWEFRYEYENLQIKNSHKKGLFLTYDLEMPVHHEHWSKKCIVYLFFYQFYTLVLSRVSINIEIFILNHDGNSEGKLSGVAAL